MALHSDAALVVEATENIGTRHQGGEAMDGRTLPPEIPGQDIRQVAGRNGRVQIRGVSSVPATKSARSPNGVLGIHARLSCP